MGLKSDQTVMLALAQGDPLLSVSSAGVSKPISDMAEGNREPRNSKEFRIVVSNLYATTTDRFFRSQNLWSAKGKSMPRRHLNIEPEFY